MNELQKRIVYISAVSLVLVGAIGMIFKKDNSLSQPTLQNSKLSTGITESVQFSNPLSIEFMRKNVYPGSAISIEQTLSPGNNFNQYLVSYRSEGLKIYGLLTVPQGQKPQNGWPVILFNHGYIPPEQYQTFPQSGQYASYYPVLSSNGYIVFKPDYRGNGNSEGIPEGAYYSPAYTIDDLNALASIKKYQDADPQRIGIWAHSMGGNITLRDLVINIKDIKAAVIWGGVVGSYDDLLNHWHRSAPFTPSQKELALRKNSRQQMIQQYGQPSSNPAFWNTIDPIYYIHDIMTPIQLDVGGSDQEVPIAFSESLKAKLQLDKKTVEYYVYPEDDHNISQNFTIAMQHSLDFFNRYLKGGE